MSALRRIELDATEVAPWLHANGFTDGLPVGVPTEDAVAAMVAASGRPADEPLGVMAPLPVEVTVERLAVVAVLAGCPPAAFPVVIAAAQATMAPAFRLASVQSSTSPASPLVVVNGPVREVAGLSSGTGCFGPAAGANVAVGRAVRLALQVIGGGQPGTADPATLGAPAKIAACLAEREEASPWPSLAERRGVLGAGREGEVPPVVGAASVFAVTGMWQISEPSASPDDVVHQVLHGMINTGHCAQPVLPEPGEQVLVLSPPIARAVATRFADLGDLQAALFDTVRVPLEWLPAYKRAATQERLESLGLPRDGLVPLAESPACFVVLVAGGDAGVQSVALSTSPLCRSVTVGVR